MVEEHSDGPLPIFPYLIICICLTVEEYDLVEVSIL